jgi:hypothetical protein
MSEFFDPQDRPLSFNDLSEKDDVTSEEVLTTLAAHVREGGAIKGGVVIELVERAQLKTSEFHILAQLADNGAEAQQRVDNNSQPPFTSMQVCSEYLDVLDHALFNMMLIALNN